MKRKYLFAILDLLALFLTIVMVLYGLVKGFDAFELITTTLYFMVMVITNLIHVLEQIRR